MRTIIDIPDTQLDLLNIFAIQEKLEQQFNSRFRGYKSFYHY